MSGNRSIQSVTETELIEAKEALKQSVELIKYWHDMTAYLNGKTPAVIEEIWHTYYDQAPEMKNIKEALK